MLILHRISLAVRIFFKLLRAFVFFSEEEQIGESKLMPFNISPFSLLLS